MRPLQRLNRVDDLRAVAALLVFACHAGLWWDASPYATGVPDRGLFYLGRFGVAVFFVISGLVIYRPFVQAARSGRSPDLWAYAVRRVLRIVPAYWLALAFFAVLLPLHVEPLASRSFGTFAGFAQIYSLHDYYRGLPVAWTLDIELCFYAFVPIIALCVRSLVAREHAKRLDVLLVLVFGVASIAVRLLSPDGVIAGTILGYCGWFALGMALALVVVDAPAVLARMTLRPAALWLLAAVGYLLLTDHLTQPELPNHTALLEYCGLGVLAALVVLTAVCPGRDNATRPGRWLGDRSYGVYLWHYPILAWLSEESLGGWQYLSAGVCLTLLGASLSFHMVERPLMRRAASLARERLTADDRAREAPGTDIAGVTAVTL